MGRSRLQHSAVPPVFRRAKTAALVSAGNGAAPSRVTGRKRRSRGPLGSELRRSAVRGNFQPVVPLSAMPAAQSGGPRRVFAAAGQLRLLSPSRCFAIDCFYFRRSGGFRQEGNTRDRAKKGTSGQRPASRAVLRGGVTPLAAVGRWPGRQGLSPTSARQCGRPARRAPSAPSPRCPWPPPRP